MGFSDKEQQREYQRKWIAARRAAWIAENGACVVCGGSSDLEADHIDPGTKTRNVSTVWSMSPSNPIRVAELAKCQILCNSCHKAKSESPHGSLRRYNVYHCRCDPCREFAMQFQREKRARRSERKTRSNSSVGEQIQ